MGIEWTGQVVSSVAVRRINAARAVSIAPAGMHRLQMPPGYRRLLSLKIMKATTLNVRA